jgi:hypothetical protein
MDKIHEVEYFRVEGDYFIFRLDSKDFRIPIKGLSKRLDNASDEERSSFRISPSGYGIHWYLIDEDLSFNGLIRSLEAGADFVTDRQTD